METQLWQNKIAISVGAHSGNDANSRPFPDAGSVLRLPCQNPHAEPVEAWAAHSVACDPSSFDGLRM